MNNIIAYMRRMCPEMSDTTFDLLASYLTPCTFPKKHQLIREGVYSKVAYFIEKGITRSFWLVDGEEITTSFSIEGGIVFSMDELYFGKRSEEFVETIEEVDVYEIRIADLLYLFETNIELANWGRVIHQYEYRRIHQTHKERLTLSARDRYKQMQLQFPDVCQRANLGLIASYLGITLSTLSRIRSAEGM
ncbi:MAG: Crp/Fnr family transcriptional regulator [Bacteroidales bacterium]